MHRIAMSDGWSLLVCVRKRLYLVSSHSFIFNRCLTLSTFSHSQFHWATSYSWLCHTIHSRSCVCSFDSCTSGRECVCAYDETTREVKIEHTQKLIFYGWGITKCKKRFKTIVQRGKVQKSSGKKKQQRRHRKRKGNHFCFR